MLDFFLFRYQMPQLHLEIRYGVRNKIWVAIPSWRYIPALGGVDGGDDSMPDVLTAGHVHG